MTIESGRVLNERYRLIRPVGQGSQASVWVADHLALSTQVAVKLIDPELAKKEDARERFRREATAAAQLRSAHVVQILDHGIDGDQPFIVMELLDGEDLFERLQRRVRLSLQETSRILTQVARALTRAHGAGIVHRDLKPENVFLIPNEDDEIVKVLDFGVAKVNDPAKRTMQRTGVGTLIGTPHYMSPEQVKGISEVDYRSDIWSLGVIGYQCVTGELPFDSEGVGDLLIKITLGDMPIPSKVVSNIPATFDAWFAKSCDRDPKKRFETARDQAEALARAVGVTPDDESTRYRFGGTAPRKPAGVPRPASIPDVRKVDEPRPAKAAKPTPEEASRDSAAPMPLVARAGHSEPAEALDTGDLQEVTDIDAAAPVMEAPAHRPPLDSSDIDVEESLSSHPPAVESRGHAASSPLPRPAQPGRLPRDLAASPEIGGALRHVSAQSVPRSTVSGLTSPGSPSDVPPPELDGSRRRRLVGLVAFGFLTLAAVIGWRLAEPYLQGSQGAAAAAPEDAPQAPMPRTDPTGPSVTSIDPGPGQVEPAKRLDPPRPAGPMPQSGSAAPSTRASGRRAGDRAGKEPVIEYDTPPPEEDPKPGAPAVPKPIPHPPDDHGAEPE